MEILLILILLTLWLVVCAVCTAIGFYFGKNYKPKETEKESRAAPEPSEEEKKKAIKQQKEMFNMLSYTGDEQPDIVV